VVATGSVPVRFALTAEAPVGNVEIYANGVYAGSVEEGNTDGPYHSPGPGEITYLAADDGCPDSGSL
jgi:hypothetical protein